jgi:hypothetical protein
VRNRSASGVSGAGELVFLVPCGGVRLSPLGTSATNWPIVPAPGDRWGMWSGRWNENWQGKPMYSEKNLPQCHFVQHKSYMTWTWARTRATTVGSRRYSRSELLLLETCEERKQFGNPEERGTSAVGSRYQTTTGEDTADWEDWSVWCGEP